MYVSFIRGAVLGAYFTLFGVGMCGTVYGIYQLTMVRVELVSAVIVNDTFPRASLSGSNLSDAAYYLDSPYTLHEVSPIQYCGRDT